jgi:LmbE family N-acetylglucosaminyl deacetylase
VTATVLQLAPHPDDEVLGAGATLLRLRAAGHRVVTLACSLGRPADHGRRRAELTEACDRAGFELRIHEPLLALSAADDRAAATAALAATVARLCAELGAAIVVAPSPHDGHHGHEAVGRAAVRALAHAGAPRLWLWGLWSDLPLPTLYVPFGDATLARAQHALAAHVGELARNPFDALLGARATAARVLGAERVFGFGAPGRADAHAELLCEVAYAGGEWWAGAPRVLDPAEPLAPVPRERPLGAWLAEPSLRERLSALRRPPPVG